MKKLKIKTRKQKEKSREEWIGNSELSERVTVLVPKDLHQKFKTKAISNDTDMSEVLRDFIIKYVS